uniref:Uncharacterized protein n=1 Tax=Setaria italica TaxID=4555 RepID=K3YKU3_SETIT
MYLHWQIVKLLLIRIVPVSMDVYVTVTVFLGVQSAKEHRKGSMLP